MANRAEIDCSALRRNVRRIQAALPVGCHIAAVVKGDAYGHGMAGVVRALSPMSEVEMFVVSSLEEAMQVRQTGSDKPVLILNRVLARELRTELAGLAPEERRAAAEQFVFSAYGAGDVERFSSFGAWLGCPLRLHLRLDFSAGMRGLTRREFLEHGEALLESPGVRMLGLYAHIYSVYVDPEEGVRDIREYADVFDSLPERLRRRLKLHLLSSVSFFRAPEASYDLVRVGAALYGMPVKDDRGISPELEPVMTIRARVVSCVDVESGGRVDYTDCLDPDVKRVAMISIGSWDIPGFFASLLVNGGRERTRSGNLVRIGTHLCHMVGTPCMDSCCVDITGLTDVRIGDEVIVLGPYPGVTVNDWLERTGFGLEDCQMLFSGLNRVPKCYTNRDDCSDRERS